LRKMAVDFAKAAARKILHNESFVGLYETNTKNLKD